jgi:hypothetical protein
MTTTAELEALVVDYEAVLRQIVDRAHYVQQHPFKREGKAFNDGFASGWEEAALFAARILPGGGQRRRDTN